MYISPYYEGLAFMAPPAPVSAAEIPERPDSDQAESGKVGEFSQILAGMLREAEGDNTQIQEDSAADNVLLAENDKISIESEADSEIFPSLGMELLSAQTQHNVTINTDSFPAEEAIPAEFAELGQYLPDTEQFMGRPDLLSGADTAKTQAEIALDENGAVEAALLMQSGADAEVSDLAGLAGNAGAAGVEQPQQNAGQDRIAHKEKITQGGDAARLSSGIQAAAEQAVAARSDEVLAQKAGEAKKGRLEEARLENRAGRERRQDRLSIEVRDYRSGQANGEIRGVETRVNAGAELRTSSESAGRELTLELHLPDPGNKAPLSEANWGTKAAFAFEDLLARELHQNFNNDIVRHASMVLRDEGKGMIRLNLKPDTLGNVKIRLEMAENRITGQIIVESEEALKAFQKEIHSLEQAFKESGFQDASLDMSLAADSGGAEQFQQWEQARSLLSGFQAATRYDVH